jgi:hypothetical protein
MRAISPDDSLVRRALDLESAARPTRKEAQS